MSVRKRIEALESRQGDGITVVRLMPDGSATINGEPVAADEAERFLSQGEPVITVKRSYGVTICGPGARAFIPDNGRDA